MRPERYLDSTDGTPNRRSGIRASVGKPNSRPSRSAAFRRNESRPPRLTDLIASSEFEILAAFPGTGDILSFLRAQRAAHAEPLARGVQVCLLLETRVLAVTGLLDELRRTPVGASLQFSEYIGRSVSVFDRRVAALGSPHESPSDASTLELITNERTVAALYDHLHLLWKHSVSIGLSRSTKNDVGAADEEVVRALRSGQTDEAAARQLGLSVRTYRRRVGSLMQRLGARSRFEAGYLASDPRREGLSDYRCNRSDTPRVARGKGGLP